MLIALIECLNRLVMSLCGASRRKPVAPFHRSFGLFILNFIYMSMKGKYIHKLILRGECDDWLIPRTDHYPTRQPRLQLPHVPGALSSSNRSLPDSSV